MYRKYYKNNEKSIEIYKKYKNIIKKRACYRNIWDLFMTSDFCKNNPGAKIAYGYAHSYTTDNDVDIYVRHAFVIDGNIEGNNIVVDPTLANKEVRDYYIFKTFSWHEYLDRILKNKGDLSLSMDLEYIRIQNAFLDWGFKHHIYGVG